jgi:hypothetical protein
MYGHVVRWKSTDVSDEHVASIIRVEEQAKYDAGKKQSYITYNTEIFMALFATWFTLASCLYYPSTLKMEAPCSSKISADFQQNARRYIPENRTLHNHICKGLSSFYSFCAVSWLLPPSWANEIL